MTQHHQSTATTPSSSSDVEEIFSPDIWLMRLRQLIPDNSLEPLRGLTIHIGEHHPDPETLAAQTFLDALISYHQGTQPEQSAILCFFNYDELAIGDKTAHMYVLLFSTVHKD